MARMRTYRILCNTFALVPGFLLLAACQNPQDPAALRQGYEALDRKNYDQAQAAADRYLVKTPSGGEAAEAKYLRGRAIEQRAKRSAAEAAAQLREAAGLYDEALRLNPTPHLEGYIRTSLGNVLYWLDEYEPAEAQWAAAYDKLDHADLKGWVLYRIGLCHQRLGRWKTADATFESVIRHFPGTEPAQRALARHGAKEFYVQVAAFQSATSADRLIGTLRSQGISAVRMTKPQKSLHFVMAGPLPDYRQAQSMRTRVVGAGFADAVITP